MGGLKTKWVIMAWLVVGLAGCSSAVKVQRRAPLTSHDVQNVAVLLFHPDGGEIPPEVAELATDAFTYETKRYFPAIVDRYRVRDFLRQNGYEHAVSPNVLRHMAEEFDVDGVFVGTITGYSEKESFLGWNGKPHFMMGCRLISTHTSKVLITGRVNMKGSYARPVESHQERVVLGVRMLTERMKLEERFGMLYVGREDGVWQAAMRHYERKRFWKAAENFGAIVGSFAKSDLRDEAQLYFGRCMEELDLHEAAGITYDQLEGSKFDATASYQKLLMAFQAGDDDRVETMAATIISTWPGAPECDGARYHAGLASMRSGSSDRAATLLHKVDRRSPWWAFARYAHAGALRDLGDETGARLALEDVASISGNTESDRRLRNRAHLTLGDYHYSRHDFDAATDRYRRVNGGEYEVRATLGLAWIAAESGRFGDALTHLDELPADLSPRWRGEVGLLAGTCAARLGLYEQSARELENALAACAHWREAEVQQAVVHDGLRATHQVMAADMRPYEREVYSILIGEGSVGSGERLKMIRDRHDHFVADLAFFEERRVRDDEPDEEALLRRQIRERVEFALAQVRHEKDVADQQTSGGSQN